MGDRPGRPRAVNHPVAYRRHPSQEGNWRPSLQIMTGFVRVSDVSSYCAKLLWRGFSPIPQSFDL